MKLSELLKDDSIVSIRKFASRVDESARFQSYVASADELKSELADAEKSLALYKSQNKMPMVTKMEGRIKDIKAKLKKAK